jgi:6-phosphogluconolactonase (cycloisomerase 2 family)
VSPDGVVPDGVPLQVPRPGSATSGIIWVGGYTAEMDGTGDGIGLIRRASDGALELVGTAAVTASPSFLLLRGDVLYAAGESGPTVSAFRVDGASLVPLATEAAAGTYPCALTAAGGFLIASCYGDGAVGLHRLGATGIPGAVVQTLRNESGPAPHAPHGPHTAQDGPHAHAALQVDATTVLTTDLGTDRVHVHRLTRDGLTRTGSVVLPEGCGPRDLRLHPSGLVWVLAELGNEIFVLRREQEAGAGARGGFTVSAPTALPGAEPGDHSAAIAVSADGRFAYVGLRGSDRVAVLAVSPDGASMAPLASIPSGGKGPRHLVIDGAQLHIANQGSNSVDTFDIGADGIPVQVGTLAVPSPTYLLVG